MTDGVESDGPVEAVAPFIDDDRPQIAASERDLLVMARALVTPDLDPWTTPRQSRKLPPHIGPTAAQLIGEALSHAWLALWRRGGTAPGHSLDGETVRRGRAWQRHQPVALEFTAASIALLRWLVSTPPSIARDNGQPLSAMRLSLGDEVALYLALDAAQGSFVQTALARQPFTAASPLAWLGFAHAMPDRDPPEAGFASLVTGPCAIVVESIQGDLAARWRQVELMKRGAEIPQGPDAVDRQGDRPARPPPGRDADRLHDGVRHRASPRPRAVRRRCDRAAARAQPASGAPAARSRRAAVAALRRARRAAGSLVRALLRWRTWDTEHRAIRFVDDGYQAAQLLLVRYEAVGTAGGERADAWLHELSQLTPTAPSATVPDPREPA